MEHPIACLEQRCNCRHHNGFLTRRGYELAEEADQRYLDKVGSVSGLRRDEMTMIFDDGVLDEQHRRFLEQEYV